MLKMNLFDDIRDNDHKLLTFKDKIYLDIDKSEVEMTDDMYI